MLLFVYSGAFAESSRAQPMQELQTEVFVADPLLEITKKVVRNLGLVQMQRHSFNCPLGRNRQFNIVCVFPQDFFSTFKC